VLTIAQLHPGRVPPGERARVEQFERHRRYQKHGTHTGHLDEPGEPARGEVRQREGRGPRPQCEQQHGLCGVGAHGERVQESLRVAERQPAWVGRRTGGEVGVGGRDALRPTGGAGGVEDLRRVVRARPRLGRFAVTVQKLGDGGRPSVAAGRLDALAVQDAARGAVLDHRTHLGARPTGPTAARRRHRPAAHRSRRWRSRSSRPARTAARPGLRAAARAGAAQRRAHRRWRASGRR
jgi:hypothetical protein